MIVIRFNQITIESPLDSAKPKAEPGSLLYKEPKQDPKQNPETAPDFRSQFDSLVAHAQMGPDDAPPKKWWYLVFKPYEDMYAEYNEWYKSAKFPNWARDKLKKQAEHMVWTVEKDAKTFHVNMLVYTEHDLSDFHDYSYNGYCKVYCKPCHDYRDCVFYIFKEATSRLFIQYVDYYISQRDDHRTIVPKNKPSFVHACVARARKALFG